MTRHAKNCTAHTVYTYYERKKDALRSGYGTQELRLGKDSIRGFDCCCLTLQTAKDPVVTPEGFLYDRAAILEYIVNQKAEYQRKLKLYEKQKARAEAQVKMHSKAEKDEEARRFLSLNTLETHAKASAQAAEAQALASALSLRESSDQPALKAASFWTPSTSSEVKNGPEDLIKPDPVVRCPMSGKPIKYKDLVSVKFTKFVEDDQILNGKSAKPSSTTNVRYCCAVSKGLLTNATPLFVLKTSGAVVTKQVVDTVIRKEMLDPINGKQMTTSDFVELQRGSLGFADERNILTAKRHRPSMQT
ncbi:Nitric oxide synthase-interacting protein [Fasciolopsis buskii]|uniref:Nitric oxide synthase-interacting protein n=1 Tax=Fasciolopsis buskii TaxID=27845 RepID=A0A8E0RMP6_9TREM|nr:Nitric oxide synthase-interacting protein [Fasciolopsis buski]